MNRQAMTLMGSLMILGLVSGCGGAAVPNQEMASAKAAVSGAEVGGAADEPQAELRLKHARDRIAEAEGLIEEGENEAAARKLREAQADAELALAISLQAKAIADAEASLKRIKQLMEQTQS